jgi:YebC/PmpR family DNA-binding regulatory protein
MVLKKIIMGRQWLLAHREVASLKKSQAATKLSREIVLAVKSGGPDPTLNARLQVAVDRAKKESVSKDTIERAIAKGAGTGKDAAVMELVIFEGYTPHKVPVLVEAWTDNNNRTSSEIRVLFRKGTLGQSGSMKFLFNYVGLVEAHRANDGVDPEEAAIEAGANEVESLSHAQNDDIPADRLGAKFVCDRTATGAVSQWLAANGWTVVTCELGYLPKDCPTLTEDQQGDVGAFLQALDDHDDVHRIYAAVK